MRKESFKIVALLLHACLAVVDREQIASVADTNRTVGEQAR
jgi:hypothetical protein